MAAPKFVPAAESVPKAGDGSQSPKPKTDWNPDARFKIEDVRKQLHEQGRLESGPRPTGASAPPWDKTLQPGRPGTATRFDKGVVGGPRADIKDVANIRFNDRLKAGQFDPLTKGQVAQRVKLGEQFKLHEQGDVARRLELQNHVGNLAHLAHVTNANVRFGRENLFLHDHPYYHGRISPIYVNDCLKFHYWGPSFFAGECWYPHWHPWVGWSWNFHCRPIWDPRPLWCRPIFYDPCPYWAYWQTPVWVALPAAPCGTWVDVAPLAVPAEDYNLQLLAVRFVDPGHPEQNLGPRYRVWFRNNSARAITRPFNVVLLAGNDDNVAADLPQAGVRVVAIEAGDTQSVDVRLPVEVYGLGHDAQGNPVPFANLNVLVDADREVPETNRADNGAQLARAEILPVDPAAFQAEPQQAVSGGEIVLAGEGLGPQPGQVLVHMGGLELQGEIRGWYDLGVRLALPKLPLAAPTPAELIVVRGDGAAANPVKIVVDPGQADAAAE